jgi:hypothetical protein
MGVEVQLPPPGGDLMTEQGPEEIAVQVANGGPVATLLLRRAHETPADWLGAG